MVVLGPGLDEPEHTAELVRRALPLLSDEAWLVLDAYALGVLPGLKEEVAPFAGRLVLTPNRSEGERLLGRDLDVLEDDVAEMARTFGAVVSCQGLVADRDGQCWRLGAGQVGLATSGSGDVLAGAVAGILARGHRAGPGRLLGQPHPRGGGGPAGRLGRQPRVPGQRAARRAAPRPGRARRLTPAPGPSCGSRPGRNRGETIAR